MKLKLLFLIVIMLNICSLGCLESDNNQESGDLRIQIDIYDNSSIKIELINNDSHELTIIPLSFSQISDLLKVQDLNSSIISCQINEGKLQTPTNSDLVTLKHGDSANRTINLRHWDVNSNSSYLIEGHYKSYKKSTISKSYWQGEIYSNNVTIFLD